MNILELLSSNSYLTVNKLLAKKVGLDAAVLFADLAGSQLHWNNQKNIDYSDWFFRSRDQIEEQTTLSHKVQIKCVKLLTDAGLLQSKLKGLPAITHYLIGADECKNLINLIGKKASTSYSQTADLDDPKRLTINNISNNNKNINNINNKEILNKKNIYVYPDNFNDQLIKIANDFFVYRSEIKKPFKSQKAIDLKIKQWSEQINKYGIDAVYNSIETSIANQYQGTFIDKKYLNTNNNTQNGTKNYENSNDGREQFISNIRQRALQLLSQKDNIRNNNNGA